MSHRVSPSAVLAAFLALVALGLVQAPAHAAAPSYVALGDSYASGTGTRSYLADGTSCQRSASAYPKLVAAARGYALTFKACSGATVSTVTNTQLSALTASTSYVSISVGGNDAGFAGVLTECAQPGWLSNCNAGTWFSPAEEDRLNATADLLNSRTSAQAGAKGFAFANPTSRFVGHAVCDSPEWLNGLSSPVSESYHPNKAGHAGGYTPVVSPLLTGAP